MAGAYWGFIISAAIGAYFYEDKKGDASDYVRKDCVRKDFDRIFTREQKTEEHSGIDYCIHEGKLAGTNRLLSKIDGTISGFSHILGKSWGCFNKNVLFDGAWDESDTIVMLFSRSSALSCDGKTYGIGKERDMLLISAHLLIMMVAVVPVAILSGILSCSAFCSMMIRGISSRGYGKEMIDGKNRGRII